MRLFEQGIDKKVVSCILNRVINKERRASYENKSLISFSSFYSIGRVCELPYRELQACRNYGLCIPTASADNASRTSRGSSGTRSTNANCVRDTTPSGYIRTATACIYIPGLLLVSVPVAFEPPVRRAPPQVGSRNLKCTLSSETGAFSFSAVQLQE